MLDRRVIIFVNILSIFLAVLSLASSYLYPKNNDNNSAVQIFNPELISNTEQGIRVEISGAVNAPGVYNLAPNNRVADLIERAGGFHPNVFSYYVTRQLNLAAHLHDAEKLYIPYMFEKELLTEVLESAVVKLNTVIATNIVKESTTTTTPNQTGGKININTASLNDIDTLPGIGQTYAQKIIDNRPYASIDSLKTSKIIPASTFEKIKGMVSI